MGTLCNVRADLRYGDYEDNPLHNPALATARPAPVISGAEQAYRRARANSPPRQSGVSNPLAFSRTRDSLSLRPAVPSAHMSPDPSVVRLSNAASTFTDDVDANGVLDDVYRAACEGGNAADSAEGGDEEFTKISDTPSLVHRKTVSFVERAPFHSSPQEAGGHRRGSGFDCPRSQSPPTRGSSNAGHTPSTHTHPSHHGDISGRNGRDRNTSHRVSSRSPTRHAVSSGAPGSGHADGKSRHHSSNSPSRSPARKNSSSPSRSPGRRRNRHAGGGTGSRKERDVVRPARSNVRL